MNIFLNLGYKSATDSTEIQRNKLVWVLRAVGYSWASRTVLFLCPNATACSLTIAISWASGWKIPPSVYLGIFSQGWGKGHFHNKLVLLLSSCWFQRAALEIRSGLSPLFETLHMVLSSFVKAFGHQDPAAAAPARLSEGQGCLRLALWTTERSSTRGVALDGWKQDLRELHISLMRVNCHYKTLPSLFTKLHICWETK